MFWRRINHVVDKTSLKAVALADDASPFVSASNDIDLHLIPPVLHDHPICVPSPTCDLHIKLK